MVQGHRPSSHQPPVSLPRAESCGGTVRMTSLSSRSSSTGTSLMTPVSSPMLRAHLKTMHSQTFEGAKGSSLDGSPMGGKPAGCLVAWLAAWRLAACLPSLVKSSVRVTQAWSAA